MAEKKKIVIVEDDTDLRKTLTKSLSSDFAVFEASDGETGERMIEETKPDLIILDLILPQKSGFDVLKSIREKSDLKNTPVVVLTNLEEKNAVEKTLMFGVKIYLVKALYALEEIVEIVKNTLK